MNSTHAAWGNWAMMVLTALLPSLATMPVGSQAASYAVAVATGINGALHILLPDAPK